MSYLVNYKNWKRLYEATFAFDPSGNYPDETFGLPTGGVDSGKVSPGGAGGDWDGSMQRALAFGKIANEFVGKNIISSQKRTQVKTASNRTSDHFDGQDFTYAVDLGCNLETGDRLLAHLMDWFGHPEYKGGTWFNVVKDGYRYQVGWRVPNHFNHIHVGVKKQDGKDSVSGVTTPAANSPAATELTTNNQDINMAQIQSGAKLLKSGATGDIVKALQTKLKELGYFTKEPNSEYDKDTYAAVKAFQTASNIGVDGIFGPATYGALFGVQVDPNAVELTKVERGKVELSNGKLKSSYSGEKQNNINLLINEMTRQGITNPYSQVGILAVIGKECGFIPKNENMNYSKERLPEVWGVFSKTGKMVPKGQGQANYNDLAVQYERNPEKLANFVYGQKPNGMRTNAYGNTQPGDGWKYRGRGFNGITFKSGYQKYATATGLDLINNPDMLNDPATSAKVAVLYFINTIKPHGIDLNSFTSTEDATRVFVRANAGWGSDQTVQSWAYANAAKIIPNFTIEPGAIA